MDLQSVSLSVPPRTSTLDRPRLTSQHARRNAWICSPSVCLSVHALSRDVRQISTASTRKSTRLTSTHHARRLSQHARRNAWICSPSVCLSVHALSRDVRQISTASTLDRPRLTSTHHARRLSQHSRRNAWICSPSDGTSIWNFSQTLDSDEKFRYSTLNSTKVDIQCNKQATVGNLIKLTVLAVVDARPRTWNSLSH